MYNIDVSKNRGTPKSSIFCEMKMSMRFFMLDNFLCFGGWVGAVTPAILAQG